jgi:predicted RNase H-like HicB family nuclease
MAENNYKRLARVFEYELPIKVSRAGGYYLAKCPDWPDCYAQGDSFDEAISEIKAVAASLIELYREEGLAVPLERSARSKIVQPQTILRVPILVSA